MRFQQICDPRARSAAVARARRRPGPGPGPPAAAVGLLAAAACCLAVTACGSQAAPGASSGGTAMAAAKSPDSPSPAGGDSSSPAACTTAGISVTLTDTGALGGQAGGYLKFTDQGRVPCQMTGWPVVVAVTAAGTATARAARAVNHVRRLALHCAAACRAYSNQEIPPMRWWRPVTSRLGSSTHCPAPYVRLRVARPGDRDHVTISAWLPGARSYLPACTVIDGSPTAATSAIMTLSRLPH